MPSLSGISEAYIFVVFLNVRNKQNFWVAFQGILRQREAANFSKPSGKCDLLIG